MFIVNVDIIFIFGLHCLSSKSSHSVLTCVMFNTYMYGTCISMQTLHVCPLVPFPFYKCKSYTASSSFVCLTSDNNYTC